MYDWQDTDEDSAFLNQSNCGPSPLHLRYLLNQAYFHACHTHVAVPLSCSTRTHAHAVHSEALFKCIE
jgi:hypothetical protein